MIRIAQASSSETFGKYGTAPNQRRTGATAANPGGNMDGELNVIAFNGGWECVYRPIDDGVADRIATFMEKAVRNGSHIGYSQDATRVGVFDECKKMASPDPEKITVLVNCDCATLVGAAIYFAGIKDDKLRKLCTWEMEEVLLKTNAFVKLSTKELCQEGKGIRRGDVMWRSGHTACSLDTDKSEPRISLTENGLVFADNNGEITANYPADGSQIARKNGVRTVRLDGNAYYLYSTQGTSTYNLENDATYMVTFCNRNSKSTSNDAVWIIAAHKTASHIFALKSSTSTKASVDGLVLSVKRGAMYGRVTITRLS